MNLLLEYLRLYCEDKLDAGMIILIDSIMIPKFVVQFGAEICENNKERPILFSAKFINRIARIGSRWLWKYCRIKMQWDFPLHFSVDSNQIYPKNFIKLKQIMAVYKMEFCFLLTIPEFVESWFKELNWMFTHMFFEHPGINPIYSMLDPIGQRYYIKYDSNMAPFIWRIAKNPKFFEKSVYESSDFQNLLFNTMHEIIKNGFKKFEAKNILGSFSERYARECKEIFLNYVNEFASRMFIKGESRRFNLFDLKISCCKNGKQLIGDDLFDIVNSSELFFSKTKTPKKYFHLINQLKKIRQVFSNNFYLISELKSEYLFDQFNIENPFMKTLDYNVCEKLTKVLRPIFEDENIQLYEKTNEKLSSYKISVFQEKDKLMKSFFIESITKSKPTPNGKRKALDNLNVSAKKIKLKN